MSAQPTAATPFLATADWHLTLRPADEYRWEILDWLAVQAPARSVQEVIVCGDLTETKDGHPAALVNRLVAGLRGLVAAGVRVRVVCGNHDYVDQACPFFQFLAAIPGINFYTQETTVGTWHFVPHRKYHDKTVDPLVSAPKGVSHVFLHQTFTGAEADTGAPLRGIPLARIAPELVHGAHVLSGDVHVPQSHGNVIYIGSPHPVVFTRNRTKYRVIFYDGNKSKSVTRSVPGRLCLRVRGLADFQEQAAATLTERDQLKVVVELARRDFCDWGTIKKQIQQHAESLGVTVAGLELRERATKTKTKASGEAKAAATTPADVLSAYCVANKVDDKFLESGVRLLAKE